jgi:hypothetical protein
MYEPVCPDIFKGGRDKAMTRVDSFGLSPETLSSIKSIIGMTSDYAWLLVATAKWSEGDDIGAAVLEKWEAVKSKVEEETEKLVFAGDDEVTLSLYYGSMLNACYSFTKTMFKEIGLVIDGRYHVYGFLYYLGCCLRASYDFLAIVGADINNEFLQLKPQITHMIELSSKIGAREYEAIMLVRKEVNESINDIPGIPSEITYKKMFTTTTSIREFRNALSILINTAIIGDQAGVGDKMEGLLKKLRDSGIVDIIAIDEKGRHRADSRFEMPHDIEKDDFLDD